VRLLTLTGPGGVGKTRLAVQVAAGMQDAFPAGVVFVALAAVRDPAQVLPTIARTLDLRDDGVKPVADSLATALRARELLLVLDNCEQVTGAGPPLAALLTRGPRMRMLVTSRAALRVQGEQEYAVPTLPLPERTHHTSPEEVTQYAAVQVFVQRAQAVQPHFQLTTGTVAAVVGICRRLDGLPLALELAAARSKLLTPVALLARLEHILPVLTGGGPDRPARHQTLAATLAWSYDLLAPGEQAVFRRLAVFVGGGTLEAIEAVCGEPGLDVPAALSGLVDQSLVQVDAVEGPSPRCRMLETIREYAAERLEAEGEARQVEQQHALHFLGLAHAAAAELTGPTQVGWLARLAREHDNLRAALRCCLAADQTVEAGAVLAADLWRFWSLGGYVAEGRRWLADILRRRALLPPEPAARILYAAGALAFDQADYGQSAAFAEESLVLRQQAGDRVGIAESLNSLGNAAWAQGEGAQATALYKRSLALWRDLGDRYHVALCIDNLGAVATVQGDYARARVLHDESLELRRQLGDTHGVALSLYNVGTLASLQGEYSEADALFPPGSYSLAGLGRCARPDRDHGGGTGAAGACGTAPRGERAPTPGNGRGNACRRRRGGRAGRSCHARPPE
jgi:predicted ATPase